MVRTLSVTVTIVLLATLFAAGNCFAQFPVPEIHSVFPPAIEAGKTTEVSLNGVNLDELETLQFSMPGFKAEPVMLPATKFRKSPVRNGNKFLVTAPQTGTMTMVEIRASGFFGLSTSRPLTIEPAGKPLIADSAGGNHHKIESAPELAREALGYGTTDANRIDWWRFSSKKGERLLIHSFAERIESQADVSLKVVDGRGFELEANRDSIGRDALIDFTAPMDGNYWVGVHDLFFRGGANFPYLLRVSAAPWIDAVMPPSGKPGTTYNATLIGRNLPGGSRGNNEQLGGAPLETLSVQIAVPAKEPPFQFSSADPATALLPTFPYRYQNSNTIQLGFSSQPVAVTPESAGPGILKVPSETVSRFDEKSDTDHYLFQAEKGKTYSIEIIADRMNDQSDPFLIVEKVIKENGEKATYKLVKEQDDHPNSGRNTFHNGSRDTSLLFTADESSSYRITVLNQFNTGNAAAIYRLALRMAQPDFEIIAVAERPYLEQRQAYPSPPFLRKGGTFPMRLLINRKDGFDGSIRINASGLPKGVSCPEVTVNPGEQSIYLTLAASKDAPHWSGTIQLEATAKAGETSLRHPVRMGTIVLGNNDYNVARIKSRLSSGFPLAVSKNEDTPVRVETEDGKIFEVATKKQLAIPFKLINQHELKGAISVTVLGLEGLKKPPVISVKEGESEGTLTIDFTPKTNVFDAKEGTWNFVLKATGVTKYRRNPQAADRAAKELTEIEAISKQVATEAAAAANLVEERKKTLIAAKKNLSTASPDAKPPLDEEASKARAALAEAEAALKKTESLQAQGIKEVAAAKKRADALTKAASAKDVKFAAWSLPLTVKVLPEETKK